MAGNSLANASTWQFTTADGAWGDVTNIGTDETAGNDQLQLGVVAAGNVVAVWPQGFSASRGIWANHYTLDSGWSSPEQIANSAPFFALSPAVGVAANGDVVAVSYPNETGSPHSIWSNRYTIDNGWGSPELVETDSANTAILPQVTVGPTGNALAVWVQSNSNGTNISANNYAVGSGWGSAELIETDNSGSAYDPQIAVDSNGNAFAIWQQVVGGDLNVYINRFE